MTGVELALSASAAAPSSAVAPPLAASSASLPLALPADPVRAPVQKGATSPKPSGRVQDTAKGGAKVPDTKAPPPKPRSTTDLGF